MKRLTKTNQRKKQLNRQHHKITARRQSHFAQSLNESFIQQEQCQAN